MQRKLAFFLHFNSVLVSLIGILAFFSDATGIQNASAVILFVLYPSTLLMKRNPSIVLILVHAGIFFSTFVPVVSFYFSDQRHYTIILFITCALFLMIPDRFVSLGASAEPRRNSATVFSIWIASLMLAAIIAITSPLGAYSSAVFHVLFGLSLVALEYQFRGTPSKYRAYILITLQASLVLIFYNFQWTGGGRILMGSIVMMFAALIHCYGYVRIRFFHIFAIGPLLILFGHVLRYGLDGEFELHSGSVGTPIINAYDFLILNVTLSTKGLSGFFDQVLLFFFNWVPRAIWQSKPIGLGYSMVDDYLGRVGLSDDHSTAPGMIGEALWFFDGNFLVGAILTLAVFFTVLRAVNRISSGYAAPALIFASFTANLLWGGLASIGARVWFFLMPALALIVFIESVRAINMKKIEKNETRAHKF